MIKKLSFGEFAYKNKQFVETMDNTFIREVVQLRMSELFPLPAARMPDAVARSFAEDKCVQTLRCRMSRVEPMDDSLSKLQKDFDLRHTILRYMRDNAKALTQSSWEHIYRYDQIFPVDQDYTIEKPRLTTYAQNTFSEKGREFNRAADNMTGGPSGQIKRWIYAPLAKNLIIDPSP